MSTRAIYTFRANQEEYHVYKHMDGYPTGAAQNIAAALAWAWNLPRFEPDQFAAAFVAACITDPTINGGKKPADQYKGGDLRLMPSGNWRDLAPGDIEYRYEITGFDGEIMVHAYAVDSGPWDAPKLVWTEEHLFSGTLAKFAKWATAARSAA